jgi:hypothetical protein
MAQRGKARHCAATAIFGIAGMTAGDHDLQFPRGLHCRGERLSGSADGGCSCNDGRREFACANQNLASVQWILPFYVVKRTSKNFSLMSNAWRASLFVIQVACGRSIASIQGQPSAPNDTFSGSSSSHFPTTAPLYVKDDQILP